MKSSPKKILVDTNVYVGFYNKDDALHERALAALLKGDEFVTTEHVFIEILNVLTRRAGMTVAREAGNELLSRDITLLQPIQKEFDLAWKLFAAQKKLSFTDCINIILAKTSGCDAIATFDEEYQKVKGVTILK